MKNNKFQFYDLKINMKVEHMKKNPYALFFAHFRKKVIKKLLTFCYWCPHKALPILEKIVYT